MNASGSPVIKKALPPIVGDTVSAAFAMNDTGIVVGASGACGPPFSATSSTHAVLWKEGSNPHVLGSLGGVLNNFAGAVNNQGWVAGNSDLPGDTVTHSFLWREGVGITDLGSLLPDDTLISMQSMNNRGEVVGFACGPSEPNGCDPYYWRNGVMIDLSLHLTQPTRLQILVTGDINDRGEITAVAFDPNFNGGDNVSILLVPVQAGPPTAENLPLQNAAAVQRSVLPSATLQRLIPRLRGWTIAR